METKKFIVVVGLEFGAVPFTRVYLLEGPLLKNKPAVRHDGVTTLSLLWCITEQPSLYKHLEHYVI
jgi:hypothetical protein